MKTYYIEALDCANCALKIENKLNTLPGLKHATLNFATGELQVEALDETSGDLFEKINAVVQKMEPDAVLTQTKHHSHAGNHCCDSCGEISSRASRAFTRCSSIAAWKPFSSIP